MPSTLENLGKLFDRSQYIVSLSLCIGSWTICHVKTQNLFACVSNRKNDSILDDLVRISYLMGSWKQRDQNVTNLILKSASFFKYLQQI